MNDRLYDSILNTMPCEFEVEERSELFQGEHCFILKDGKYGLLQNNKLA